MIIKNLIYILQSENYNWARFLKFAYRKLDWRDLEKRKKLVWTPKARLIYALTIFLFFFFAFILIEIFSGIGILFSFFLIAFLPFIIGVSLLIIKPVDFILKRRRIERAKIILAGRKLTVIGITGSYGKTSAKEILNTILAEEFKVLKTPENINTDIGIANFIIKNDNKLNECDIFIVEMGAYKTGDIAKICDMVEPDYSILSGINESHLERFGSLDNIINGKFELPERTNKISFLNFDDENIRNNFNRFKIREAVKISSSEAKNIKLKDNFEGLEFEFRGEKFSSKLLARHNIALILLAAEVAKKLGINYAKISESVAKIKPLLHRLEPIYNSHSNIWVIDDSYNANFNGILSGLEVLERFSGRKIILTPGLVELGGKSREIHNKIGEAYAKKANLVLLIKNSATKYILEGLNKNNFQEFKIYNSAKDAHNNLTNVLEPGDAIIFQNDWPDNYL